MAETIADDHDDDIVFYALIACSSRNGWLNMKFYASACEMGTNKLKRDLSNFWVK
jgi:hypothetical protein